MVTSILSGNNQIKLSILHTAGGNEDTDCVFSCYYVCVVGSLQKHYPVDNIKSVFYSVSDVYRKRRARTLTLITFSSCSTVHFPSNKKHIRLDKIILTIHVRLNPQN